MAQLSESDNARCGDWRHLLRRAYRKCITRDLTTLAAKEGCDDCHVIVLERRRLRTRAGPVHERINPHRAKGRANGGGREEEERLRSTSTSLCHVGSTHIGDRFRRRDARESEEMTSEVTKFHREDIDRYEGKLGSSGSTVYNFAASVGAEA